MARIWRMSEPSPQRKRPKRPKKPLDAARLEELALAYVARFATSAGKLEAYLNRKLRERGFEGSDEGCDDGVSVPDPSAIVQKFVERGYVDDRGYASAKSSDLLQRGYGPRRVDQALMQAGINEHLRSDLSAGEADRRSAAVRMARKRRFGPFDPVTALDDEGGRGLEAHKRREKQLAALVRAGHEFGDARFVLGAASEAELEQWIDEAREQEDEAYD